MDTMTPPPRFDQKASRANDGEPIQSEIAALKTEFGELAASVAAAAKSGVEELHAAADERTGELRNFVRANPTQAALLSAGVGFMLGLLLTR